MLNLNSQESTVIFVEFVLAHSKDLTACKAAITRSARLPQGLFKSSIKRYEPVSFEMPSLLMHFGSSQYLAEFKSKPVVETENHSD